MATTESFHVNANELLAKVKQVLHEGNVRRIAIRQDSRTIAEFPLTVGVIGAAFAPILVAVGAIAAVLTDCTIVVERRDAADEPEPSPAPSEPSAFEDVAPDA